MAKRPRVAVFKFASCDGCQLTLLDCEDELLALGEKLDIVHFLEASDRHEPGPYDVTLVEGSITTPHDGARETIGSTPQQAVGIIVLGRWLTRIVDDLLLPEVRPMWYKHAWHDDAGG